MTTRYTAVYRFDDGTGNPAAFGNGLSAEAAEAEADMLLSERPHISGELIYELHSGEGGGMALINTERVSVLKGKLIS